MEYYGGIKLQDTRVWSFTGYRKVSPPKKYDGGGFYFTKSLLCFRPCGHGISEGKCTKKKFVLEYFNCGLMEFHGIVP